MFVKFTLILIRYTFITMYTSFNINFYSNMFASSFGLFPKFNLYDQS